MTRLVTAILARNEAAPDRYLRRVIARCKEFSDDVLVLDDNSTDDTIAVAEACGAHVARRVDSDGFWGVSETPARAQLWTLGAKIAGDGWLLVCDADMLLQGDVRALCDSWECAGWAMPLADCWDSEDTFRIDGPWALGCTTPRPWLFRPSALKVAPVWHDSRIHAGHAPANFFDHASCFVAPPDIYFKHLSYVTPEHRRAKAAQYAAVADHMNEFQRAHAATILD